jgi:hypothetical protein
VGVDLEKIDETKTPTKWTWRLPDYSEMYQMAIKYATISIKRPTEICPNWYFWYETIPSGNTAAEAKT